MVPRETPEYQRNCKLITMDLLAERFLSKMLFCILMIHNLHSHNMRSKPSWILEAARLILLDISSREDKEKRKGYLRPLKKSLRLIFSTWRMVQQKRKRARKQKLKLKITLLS